MVEALRQARVVGVLRAPSVYGTVEATLAAVRGGLRAIELTFTTPDVAAALQELRLRLPKSVLLGVGTVMSAVQAQTATEAGAGFLVSPHLSEEVLKTAQSANVPYLPGVLTPSEIVRAQTLGVEVLKIFPIGSAGGVAYLKDLFGPLPNLSVMITGGISPREVPAYLKAGALAVGLGSNLFPKEALRQGDWSAVETATQAALAEALVSS